MAKKKTNVTPARKKSTEPVIATKVEGVVAQNIKSSSKAIWYIFKVICINFLKGAGVGAVVIGFLLSVSWGLHTHPITMSVILCAIVLTILGAMLD